MSLRPLTSLPTHEVTNQVPPLEGWNLFAADTAAREALAREAGPWAVDRALAFGEVLGRPEILAAGDDANHHPPELRLFDRRGQRVDEVDFHPAYHTMMGLGRTHGVHNLPWTTTQRGGHAAHAAQLYLLGQVEPGVCCPLTMTYAVVPSLREEPEVARVWEPRATATAYDARMIPADQKSSATLGMAMTEKQGGSDVRANTTRAVRDGEGWRLTGHKWFCSAPMSDAFLTLAQTEAGITCFLVPRWLPDGTRNNFFVQRLKDKLGNRSNASSEIEYLDTWAQRVGEEGRGVPTIIAMVHHTRLDTTFAAAALGRRALVEAIHHACHRKAFGARLIEQPLMQNVLADLALDVEAAALLAFRVARAYDHADDPQEAAFGRIAVPIAKYWTNKRCPPVVAEALECLGGAGYVEEHVLPRLYREAPLNGIWEGSGNVICLDVLRAAGREPQTVAALLAELETGRGADRRLDAAIDGVKAAWTSDEDPAWRARSLVERCALTLQATLLVRHAPAEVADAFLATRLGGDWGHALGTLPAGTHVREILRRAWAPVDA
ncbi:MAG: acyl-CoA dehydrogenase family protein [Alphaproteobacteria bacterium]|nr:acyl-CoA dehydrogenase family protein [Alphaproteobacteria bacterium]